MNDEARAAAYAMIARPSGGFAMVANDGRESLRGLLRKSDKPSNDAAMEAFKAAVSRHLGPYCSGMLIDLMYGEAALSELRTAAPGTGRIVSVDVFDEPLYGGLTGTKLDRAAMAPDAVPGDVHALKFFMFWHPDESSSRREDETAAFVEGCANLGVLSLLEGVVKLPPGDPRFDDSLVAAAAEFGRFRPDLYKTQVPSLGRASAAEIERRSHEVSSAVGVPWVALSNGVPEDDFESAIRAVCLGGASGFLAGRATWSPAIVANDPVAELAGTGSARLRSFAKQVDETARPWWQAAGLPAPVTGAPVLEGD